MILAGLIAARVLHYVALSIAFGAVAYGGFAEGEATRRRLRVLALGSSLAVLLGVLAVLAATAANMAGDLTGAGDAGVWAAILTETDFGRVWAVRLGLAVALFGALLVRGRRHGSDRLAVVLAGGLAVTVALTGHAQVETGLAGAIHRLSDAAHLLAAVVWIGVLPPLLYLLARPSEGATAEAADAARRLLGFHDIGLIAVLILIATGLINSWFLVGEPLRLITSLYGRVLLLKLGLFGGMLAFAAANRVKLVPNLRRALEADEPADVWVSRLREHVRAELILGVAVLLAVGVMGAIAPAVEG